MSMKLKRIAPRAIQIAALILITAPSLHADDPAIAINGGSPLIAGDGSWDTFSDTWAATDGLGRRLPIGSEVAAPRVGKKVGIFYFLWLEGRGPVFDLAKMIAANPAAPAYGPKGAFHFWNEPLLGYYRSDDEWVIRKHVQMLTDAGVDVLLFDVTNGLTYDQTYLKVCRILAEARRTDRRAPQIAFLANSRHEMVVGKLWETFYSKNLYPEAWFRWKGKPLLLSPPQNLPPHIAEFFSIRQSWAWSNPKGWFGDGRDKWPWLDHTPQQFGWHESPDRPEQIAVAAAEHPTSNIGRSHQNGKQPPPADARAELGLYFQEQWDRALKIDPEFVFVTGWNEWIAQRFVNDARHSFLGRRLEKGETFFVDTYNQEFSRDIEPMKGGHGDNFYYQLVANIRRFKGVRPVPALSGGAIAVDGKFDDWRDIRPEFRDTLGDIVDRDHPGWQSQPRFNDASGRNDLAAAKVSADAENVYFYVRTVGPLSPPGDPNWMLLLIDADNNPSTGWLGYDFVVNRSGGQPEATKLERNVGGSCAWASPADIPYRAAGNEMELAIPRAALGLKPGPFTLDFKWADNAVQTGHWSELTLHGDAAPNDRFNYRAIFRPKGD